MFFEGKEKNAVVPGYDEAFDTAIGKTEEQDGQINCAQILRPPSLQKTKQQLPHDLTVHDITSVVCILHDHHL